MNCPGCSAPTSVINSRPAHEGGSVYRRRRCNGCGYRIHTFEVAAPESLALMTSKGSLVELSGESLADLMRQVAGSMVDTIVGRLTAEAEAAAAREEAAPVVQWKARA